MSLFWVILGVIAVVLVVVLVVMARKKKQEPEPPEPEDLSGLSIARARIGDNISISGAGDGYDDLNFTVDRKNGYASGGDEWFELSGLYRGRRVFVEVVDADELEISTNLGGVDLKFEDLGLTEEDLGRMDENEDRSESFEYDGKRWSFEESGEAQYFKDCVGEGEGFYVWAFQEEGGSRKLFVEKWEGKPFDVGLAQMISSDDVNVYRNQ